MQDLALLIIDDDLGDRKMIRRMLSQRGKTTGVFEAGTCEEALAFDGPVPDVVILDYVMPGSEGLDLLKTLRARWPRASFLVMTGQGDEEKAKSAIQLGASDYISKRTLTPPALERMVMTAAEMARMQSRIEAQKTELETFAHMLVHDFKTPIRGVTNLSRMVADDLAEGDTEAALDGLRMLEQSAAQMLELVDSLAVHIRLDREEARAETTLGALAERALIALRPDIEATGTRIEVADPDTSLLCTPPQVAQLLQNLIANAMKYTEDARPEITLSATPRETDHMTELAVTDNGIGIPETQRDAVFEPFRRISGHSKAPGTGLGLATCRKIVERHGGRIWCEEAPGGGTSMHFTLPSARQASPCGIPPDSPRGHVPVTGSDRIRAEAPSPGRSMP